MGSKIILLQYIQICSGYRFRLILYSIRPLYSNTYLVCLNNGLGKRSECKHSNRVLFTEQSPIPLNINITMAETDNLLVIP